MPHLRQVLTVFFLLFVMALTVPLLTSQDDNKSDDGSSQSDNSNDQPSDQITLSDFIFEDLSIPQNKFPDEICPEAFCEVTEKRLPIQIFLPAPILPHVFISECGLMPRAPALA